MTLTYTKNLTDVEDAKPFNGAFIRPDIIKELANRNCETEVVYVDGASIYAFQKGLKFHYTRAKIIPQ